jgi:hypothetical protein
MNDAFTRVPEVVYSATLLLPLLTTKRFEPATAIATGWLSPEVMSPGLTKAPVIAVNSPILLTFGNEMKRSDPEVARPTGGKGAENEEARVIPEDV